MNDDELRDVMRLLERPPTVPPGLTERLFSAMVAELEAEASEAPSPAAPAPARRLRPRGARVPLSRRWRLPIAAAAVASVVALVIGAVAVLTVARAPSALAALHEAQARFASVPAYHATTAVRANDDSRDPDLEATWETEDWRASRTQWRSTVQSSSTRAQGTPGDFRVASGDLYGEYEAEADLFTARPLDEVDRAADPSFFFDPSLQWWSSGKAGDPGQPTDEFIKDRCAASEETLLGRAATKLACDTEPGDVELWLDEATGLLLRVATPEVVREITRLEIDPEVPAGTFDVTPPEGAQLRWDSSAPAPPGYEVEADAAVADTYDVAGGRVDGLSIAQVTDTDVWLLVTRCNQGCAVDLVRVDSTSGQVLATIASPAGTMLDDVELVGDELWASYAQRFEDTSTPAAYVQQVDLAGNRLVGEPIETGTASGGFAVADDVLWSTSGPSRPVTVGPAQAEYHALARVDLGRREVAPVELDADAMGMPVVVGGSVWVTAAHISAADPATLDHELIEVSLETATVVRRVAVGGYPSALTTDGRRVFALVADASLRGQLAAVDSATGALQLLDLSGPGISMGGMAVAGGQLWIASTIEGTVRRLDLATLAALGAITTGRDPVDVDARDGSVWVANAGDGTLARIAAEEQ